METKFENELKKIDRLLEKVEDELPIDDSSIDYNTFFSNADKIFEIYNICAEEMCGQLVLLDLVDHSKMFKKLYHHFKQQLYNIMKFQLVIQKELNEQYEVEKRGASEIEKLEQRLKESQDKIKSLEINLNDQSRRNKTLANNLNFYKNNYSREMSRISQMGDKTSNKTQKKSKDSLKKKLKKSGSFISGEKSDFAFDESLESESSSSLMDKIHDTTGDKFQEDMRILNGEGDESNENSNYI